MDARFVWFVIALIALVATLSATELVRVCAHRLRVVDQPGGRRLHHAPTARLGGLGIFWGFCFALAAATLVPLLHPGSSTSAEWPVLGLLCASVLLLLVGWFDDVRNLAPVSKLAFQIVAACVLFASGWRVDAIGLPGAVAVPLGVLALPVTVAWVVFVTNAMNLIDGLDGLAVGLGLVAVLFATGGGPAGAMGSIFTAALVGALLGFLWFNMHPAMIFMGDAGSLFVGVMIAALTMHAGAGVPGAFPLIPALLVAVPVGDTLDAILRRAGGVPISFRQLRSLPRRVFTPDSMHFHHRLRRSGLTVRQAAATLWLTGIVFALCAQAFGHSIGAGWFVTAIALGASAIAYRQLGRAPRQAAPAIVSDAAGAPPLIVLYVINDLILGGAQRVLLDQASSLDRTRFRAEVASLEMIPGGPIADALERQGIPVHRLRRAGEPLALALPRLVRHMRRIRPSIVHTHLAAAGVAGRIAARACRVGVVLSTQHNLSDWQERRHGLLRRVDRATLELAHGIVTVSDAVRAAMSAVAPALGERSVTVRNGVDHDWFSASAAPRADTRRSLGLDADVFTILVVARLERRKGVDILLDALSRVPASGAWLLCIVGDGPERQALEALTRSLGIAHAVRFEGAQCDVRPWLWAADLCAVPSRTEGLGMTVVEALAAGTPVCASDVGGIPELLAGGGGGWLIRAEDPQAWAAALACVIAEPASLASLAAAAPGHAGRFALARSTAELAAVYESRLTARAGNGVVPRADGPSTATTTATARPESVPVLAGVSEELERAA